MRQGIRTGDPGQLNGGVSDPSLAIIQAASDHASASATEEPAEPHFSWRAGEWLRIDDDGNEEPHVMHAVGLCRRGRYHAEALMQRLGLLAERINAHQRSPEKCQEARAAALVAAAALARIIEQIAAEDLR